jgi:D-glycero-alpha-D-manno-heptose 1-phosphate guanylyltransferase
MDCIILAGGFGTRLQEVINHLPKSLAPINNQPFLEILLNQIENTNIIDRVIFSLGYMSKQITDFVSERENKFDPIFIQESSPLGTGGAIQNCIKYIKSSNYFVMNGDSYLTIDWQKFLQSHIEYKAYITIACINLLDTSRFGIIEIDSKQRIVNFVEKQKTIKPGLINGGIYCFKKGFLPYYSVGDSFSIEIDLFPQLTNKNIFAYQTNGLFIDIGTAKSYEQAQKKLAML